MNRRIPKIILAVVSALAVLCAMYFAIHIFTKKNVAIRAVNDMYSFRDINSLAKNNMEDLQKRTTEDIYNELTVKNVDRALTTYLKFKGNPVTVNIIKATNDYVEYSLNTATIDPNRKFIFFYDTNFLGKIDEVHEAELYDFYRNN